MTVIVHIQIIPQNSQAVSISQLRLTLLVQILKVLILSFLQNSIFQKSENSENIKQTVGRLSMKTGADLDLVTDLDTDNRFYL